MSGQTAIVPFTWHWKNGPLAGVTYKSKAKLNNASGTRKVYEDLLTDELNRAERGQSDD
jgi:hypothetical protein